VRCAYPPGRARQDLARLAWRRAISPPLALRRSARATCHRHVARCGPGCGVDRGASVTWRRGQAWRKRRRAAGFRRYDEILPHPPCGGRVRFAYPPGGYGRIWDCQARGEPYRLRLAPPAIGPRDVPTARRKMRAGAWGGVRRRSSGGALKRGLSEEEPQDLAPSGGRRALSPSLALRRSARATCHWHVAGCGPGAGRRDRGG
jgi:hypothetical protein